MIPTYGVQFKNNSEDKSVADGYELQVVCLYK